MFWMVCKWLFTGFHLSNTFQIDFKLVHYIKKDKPIYDMLWDFQHNLWDVFRGRVCEISDFILSSVGKKRILIWQSKRTFQLIFIYTLIQNFHRAGETISRTQQKFLRGLPWWDFCFADAVDGIRIRCLMRDAPWCAKQSPENIPDPSRQTFPRGSSLYVGKSIKALKIPSSRFYRRQ